MSSLFCIYEEYNTTQSHPLQIGTHRGKGEKGDMTQTRTTGLLSIFDAAHELGSISPWTLRKHVSQGTVRATRLGRRVFVRLEEIERIRLEGLPSLRSSSGVSSG